MTYTEHAHLRAARALARAAAAESAPPATELHLAQLSVGYGCGGDSRSPLLASRRPVGAADVRRLATMLNSSPPFTPGPTWGPQWSSRRVFDEAVSAHRADTERRHRERLAASFADVMCLDVVHEPASGTPPTLEVFAQHGCRCAHSSSSYRDLGPDEGRVSDPSTWRDLGGGVWAHSAVADPRASIAAAADGFAELFAQWRARDEHRARVLSVPAAAVAEMGFVDHEAHTAARSAATRERWSDPCPGFAAFIEMLDESTGGFMVAVALSPSDAEFTDDSGWADDGDAPDPDELAAALTVAPR